MRTYRLIGVFCLACWASGQAAQAGAAGQPPYRDPALPLDRRVEDLLGRMSLEKKVGQMKIPCVHVNGLGLSVPAKTAAVEKFTPGAPVRGLDRRADFTAGPVHDSAPVAP
jgi:hypothetical protein